jgi:hypothetical protein
MTGIVRHSKFDRRMAAMGHKPPRPNYVSVSALIPKPVALRVYEPRLVGAFPDAQPDCAANTPHV